jgi:hypothetical protein
MWGPTPSLPLLPSRRAHGQLNICRLPFCPQVPRDGPCPEKVEPHSTVLHLASLRFILLLPSAPSSTYSPEQYLVNEQITELIFTLHYIKSCYYLAFMFQYSSQHGVLKRTVL